MNSGHHALAAPSTLWWIHWEVDGASGSTAYRGYREHAQDYFDLMFKPYGYKLVRIERA